MLRSFARATRGGIGANLQLHQEWLIIAVASHRCKVLAVHCRRFGGQRVETGQLRYVDVVIVYVFVVDVGQRPTDF